MEHLFKSLLLGNTGEPEAILLENLKEICPEAVSVEWFVDGNIHEAILTEHGQEKIVRFNRDGSLVNIRINIHIAAVPENIRKVLDNSGEIMSSILIKDRLKNMYEFVLRDKLMKREIVLTNESGKILIRHDCTEII